MTFDERKQKCISEIKKILFENQCGLESSIILKKDQVIPILDIIDLGEEEKKEEPKKE